MKRMRTLLVLVLAAGFLTAVVNAADALPTGIWKWTVQGRIGGQGIEQTLKLDYKDGKLSGTLMGVHRGEFQVPDTAISDPSFADGVIRFAVTRALNGNKLTTTYEGRLEGDRIRGTLEHPALGGGESVKREWHARRVK
jgi:hypothetical protein